MKKIKAFKRYLKEHPNKIWIYFNLLILIGYVGISAYFIYSILLFKGIETLLRNALCIISGITIIIFSLSMMNVLLKGKFFRFLIYLILIVGLGYGQLFLANNLSRLYSSIGTINKETVTYSSSLVSLKSSNITKISDIKNKKIGILEDKKNIEGYILPNEIIKENKLENNNKIETYSDFIYMLNDLYDKNVDAIFLPSNYKSMYTSIDRFENIGEEVTEITKKSKTEEKKEVVSNSSNKKLTEPFTILLLGLDSESEGIENATSFNGDSIILITFNPNTLNATILSIPRDTYVPIACWAGKPKNKITHAAWQGEKCMIDTIQNFTGINIDYYVKINFKGVVELVEALGGVTVDVPIKFCEQNSDRKWGNNTICLNTGVQQLNGEQALALSRHRKTVSDFVRGQNQQLVIQAMIAKLKTIRSIDDMLNILDIVSNNMDTNLTTNQILSFYNVGKDILAKSKDEDSEIINMDHLYLSGYDKMIWDTRMKLLLYNFVYYKGSLDDIVNAMKVNLGLKTPTLIKDFSFSINETYEEQVIGKGTYKESQIVTIPAFYENTKSYAINWGQTNGVTINFKTVNSSESKYKQDQIIDQSVKSGLPLDSLNKTTGITLTIINKIEETPTKLNCKLEENETNSACLVPDMIGWTVSKLNTWIKDLPVSIVVNKVEVEATDDNKDKIGYVIEQSVEEKTKLTSITSMTVKYVVEATDEDIDIDGTDTTD